MTPTSALTYNLPCASAKHDGCNRWTAVTAGKNRKTWSYLLVKITRRHSAPSLIRIGRQLQATRFWRQPTKGTYADKNAGAAQPLRRFCGFNAPVSHPDN